MVRYEKCPRCELNYIDPEKQDYCDVCLAEMRGSKLQFADLDDEDYAEIDTEIEQEELCPVCGVNTIRAGEKMCDSCKSKEEYEEEEELDIEKDEEWKNYLDEEEGDLTVDDEELQEELDAEFGEEEEENEEEEFNDDFEEDFDEIDDDFDDDDFDDDDDDDDDEDDDF